jgi:hypothetical protein
MNNDTDRRAQKIRALLDKAEATTFPAEAEALTAKATALMASWQITEAMLAAGRPPTDRGAITTRDIELGKGHYVNARLSLLASAATFAQCRVLTSTGWNGRVGQVIGHATDVERAEMLYTSLLVQATAAAAKTPVDARSGLSTTSWRRNFLLGFARTTSDRLFEATEAAVAEADVRAARDAAHASTGRSTASVALVLAERVDEVDAWIRSHHGRVGTARPARASSSAGWTQGRAAGQRADLGLGGRLGGRRRSLGR